MRSPRSRSCLLLPMFWTEFCFVYVQITKIKAVFAVFTARFATWFKAGCSPCRNTKAKEKHVFFVLELAFGVFFRFKSWNLEIWVRALWMPRFSVVALGLQEVCLKSCFPFRQYTWPSIFSLMFCIFCWSSEELYLPTKSFACSWCNSNKQRRRSSHTNPTMSAPARQIRPVVMAVYFIGSYTQFYTKETLEIKPKAVCSRSARSVQDYQWLCIFNFLKYGAQLYQVVLFFILLIQTSPPFWANREAKHLHCSG